MAVTASVYNHVPNLIFNGLIDYANLRTVLLSNAATFTATHTTKSQVDGGSTATVTISIATPGVVTDTAHGFIAGQALAILTTGALPTGYTAGLYMYVVNPTTNNYQLALTPGGAAINTTGTQSGVHKRVSAGPNDSYGFAYPPGGPVLAGVARTQFDSLGGGTPNDSQLTATNVDVVASGGSISGYKALLYDATNQYPLEFIDFGQLQSAGDTTDFKIRWNVLGILNLTQ